MDAESAAYDQVAEAYHEAIDPEGSGLRDPVLEELVGDVDGQRVLAVGCGQGRDARRLADLGATVVAVDVSERLLGHARRLEQATPRDITYVKGNAHDLAALDDEDFDGVVCHMALMDIPELDSAITSVARVLRPGGWFVFSIVHPCYRPHVELVAGYLNEGRYEKIGGWVVLPRHAYHRPLSTVINTLSRAGLPITRMVEPPDEPATGEVPNLLYARCLKPTEPLSNETGGKAPI